MKVRLWHILLVSAMVACTSTEPELEKCLVSFHVDPDPGEMWTRGTTFTSDSFYSSGIGIFGFYQASSDDGTPTAFSVENIPDFMYNQKLQASLVSGSYRFYYHPEKYWPNGTGDLLSFIAYAPYRETTALEDLGLDYDRFATVFTHHYFIEKDVLDQHDLLWADPQLDIAKPAVATPVNFSFRHITSRMQFMLGISANGTSVTAWTDPNTTYTVDSLIVGNVHSELDYRIDRIGTSWIPSSTSSGTQTLRMCKKDNFQNATISSSVYTTAAYRQLNNADSYLHLAPQDISAKDVSLTIQLTRTTTNPANGSSASSTERFSQPLSELGISSLEEGKSYSVKYLITPAGISIKNITVEDWVTVEPDIVI